MPALTPEREHTTNGSGNEDPLIHLVCRKCFPETRPGNVSYCGTVMRGVSYPRSALSCVVCVDIANGGGCTNH